jgi:hypothetical protein
MVDDQDVMIISDIAGDPLRASGINYTNKELDNSGPLLYIAY